MPFQPTVNQEILVDVVLYRIAEHPAAPGMPYGQEGRQAVVYQIASDTNDRRALKVFKPRYRAPALVGLADQLAVYAGLPGLSVCKRTVLTPRRHSQLLRQHPDLTYAVLMPWIGGPTWMEILLEKRALSPAQSLSLARSLAGVLAELEERGLAHCDLSSPNVLLPALLPSHAGTDGGSEVALVDVEQMYGPSLNQPQYLPSGSFGYAHTKAMDGLWTHNADRFSGAILIAEMLCWCDARSRDSAWGESYFDPQEMQQDTSRCQTMLATLRDTWGQGVSDLFERAWHSDTLADCATLGEWLIALPDVASISRTMPVMAQDRIPEPLPADGKAAIYALMELAQKFVQQDRLDSALETYRQAIALAPRNSSLARELTLMANDLDARVHSAPPAPIQPPLAPPINRHALPATPLPTAFDPALDRPAIAVMPRARRSLGPLAIGGLLALIILAALVGLAGLQNVGPLAWLRQTTLTPLRESSPTVTSSTPTIASTTLMAATSDRLSELVRWEQDSVLNEGRVFGWSPRGQWFTVRSTRGLRLYSGDDFSSYRTVETGAYPAISPDEKLVASAVGVAGAVRITDLLTGQKVREWQPNHAALEGIWFAGDTLFSRDKTDTVIASDITRDPPRVLLQLDNVRGHLYTSSDGERLIEVYQESDGQSRTQQIRSCFVAEGTCEEITHRDLGGLLLDISRDFSEDGGGAYLLLRDDGQLIAGALNPNPYDTERALGTYTNTQKLPSASLSPHGTYALLDDTVYRVADGAVILTEQETSSQLGANGMSLGLYGATFSPDDRLLLGGGLPPGNDRFLVNLETKRLVKLPSGRCGSYSGLGPTSYSIAIRSDGQRAAWGCLGEDGSIDIFNTADGRAIGRLDAKTGATVLRVVFDNRDGLLAISPTAFQTRSIQDGRVLRDVANAAGLDFALADGGVYLPNSRISDGFSLRFLPHDPAQPSRELAFDPPPIRAHLVSITRFSSDLGTSGGNFFAVSNNGRYLVHETVIREQVSGNNISMIALYDTTKPQPITVVTLTAQLDANMVFSPDGKWLAAGLDNYEVELLRASDLGEERRTTSLAHDIGTLAFSPDGKYLAISAHDGVYLWQLTDDALQRLETAHESVGQAAFSPDSQLLAVVVENAVQLWDISTYRIARELDVPQPYSVAFPPDQKLLAVGTRMGSIHLWTIGDQK